MKGGVLMQEISSNTQCFRVQKDKEISVADIVASVYYSLVEKGYNPVNQIVILTKFTYSC